LVEEYKCATHGVAEAGQAGEAWPVSVVPPGGTAGEWWLWRAVAGDVVDGERSIHGGVIRGDQSDYHRGGGGEEEGKEMHGRWLS
jgi:hypothetical protein